MANPRVVLCQDTTKGLPGLRPGGGRGRRNGRRLPQPRALSWAPVPRPPLPAGAGNHTVTEGHFHTRAFRQ